MSQRTRGIPHPPRSWACAWKVLLLAERRKGHNTNQASVHLIPLRWRTWQQSVVAGCASLIMHRKKMRRLVSWQRLLGSAYWHALVTQQQRTSKSFKPLMGERAM